MIEANVQYLVFERARLRYDKVSDFTDTLFFKGQSAYCFEMNLYFDVISNFMKYHSINRKRNYHLANCSGYHKSVERYYKLVVYETDRLYELLPDDKKRKYTIWNDGFNSLDRMRMAGESFKMGTWRL